MGSKHFCGTSQPLLHCNGPQEYPAHRRTTRERPKSRARLRVRSGSCFRLNVLAEHHVSLLSLNLHLASSQFCFSQWNPFHQKKKKKKKKRKVCFIPHRWPLTQMSRSHGTLKIRQPSLQLIGTCLWGPLVTAPCPFSSASCIYSPPSHLSMSWWRRPHTKGKLARIRVGWLLRR